jgi:hypothetical protein
MVNAKINTRMVVILAFNMGIVTQEVDVLILLPLTQIGVVSKAVD